MYRQYDFVIYDATNLLGYYCIKNLFKLNSDLLKKYTFAIAGENKQNLKNVLSDFNNEKDVKHIGIIEVNITNKNSIIFMTQKCKVLLSVTEFLGDTSVIESCIDTYTHYVDISKEPQFIESLQLNFFDLVRMKKLYIINSCSLFSLPADIGILDLKNKNPNVEFISFEGFIKVDNSKSFFLNFETVYSLFGFKNIGKNLSELQNKLYSKLFVRRPFEKENKLKPITIRTSKLSKKSINVLFGRVDERIVRRTQYMLYQENINYKPSNFIEYLNVSFNFNLLAIIYSYIVMFFMSLFSLTRFFLELNPNMFTFGYIKKGDPSKEKIEENNFEFFLIGKGFEKEDKKKNVIKALHIKGPEISYNATSIFLIVSAITILKDLEETQKNNCGLVTPGYAFKNTDFIERLKSFGIKWNVQACKKYNKKFV